MVQSCKDIPAVKAMLAAAEKVLGYDLLKLCLEGPKEKLDDTAYRCAVLLAAQHSAPELETPSCFSVSVLAKLEFILHHCFRIQRCLLISRNLVWGRTCKVSTLVTVTVTGNPIGPSEIQY